MTLRGLLKGSLLYTLGTFLPRVGAFILLRGRAARARWVLVERARTVNPAEERA